MKRLMDILLIFCTLPLSIPLIAIVALANLVFLGRPIFFTQLRPGFKLRRFRLIKFRSMSDSQIGSGKVLPDSDRLSEYGKVLRSSSLDELPEIWNVLRGEMSIVGPRPLLDEYADKYTDEQNVRHDVLPGITGWAQVNGRNSLSWEDKFELDVWYARNRTLLIDIKILAMTIRQVVKRKGVSADGEATMTLFIGSDDAELLDREK